MCIIIDGNGSVVVEKTMIARGKIGTKSHLVYQNEMHGATGTMVFAVRARKGHAVSITSSRSDAMQSFAKNMNACYPQPRSRGTVADKPVRMVGDYAVSVAESGAELTTQIDRAMFKVSDEALADIAARYQPLCTETDNVVFVVCKLVTVSDRISPIVVRYESPSDGVEIIPTYHGNPDYFGVAHDWDHVIYLQLESPPELSLSAKAPDDSVVGVSPLGASSPIFGNNRVWQMKIHGKNPNDDLAIDRDGKLQWLSTLISPRTAEKPCIQPTVCAEPVPSRLRNAAPESPQWVDF